MMFCSLAYIFYILSIFPEGKADSKLTDEEHLFM